jgi:phage-related protein
MSILIFDPRLESSPTQKLFPDPGFKRAHAPKLLKTDFGDGYAQRGKDGINSDPLTDTLVWTNLTKAEKDYMDQFMIARQGNQAFLWQASDETVPNAYVCEVWDYDFVAADVYTFNATFRQVYDLSTAAVPLLSISAAAPANEGNAGTTTFPFVVTRTGDIVTACTVNWAVTGSGGSPANATDFSGGVLPSGTVTFGAGVTSQTINVLVAGDTTSEPDEGFTVTLSSPSVPAVIVSGTASTTILNDDAAPVPSLSISAPAAANEGNTGTTNFAFPVTRSGDTVTACTVNWAVTGSGGSPANAADFVGGVLPSGTLTFGSGVTLQTINVPVAGDTSVEPDEGFTVTLSSPSAPAVITTATASSTILNDDAAFSAPTPANYNVVSGGDSRMVAAANNDDTSGVSAFNGLGMHAVAKCANGWLESLTGGRLVLMPHRLTDFALSSQTSQDMATIPRPFDPTKGINYVARSRAGILLLLVGTNDSTYSGADPGKGNGAVSGTSTKSNIRFIIEYLTDPVKNAAANAALGIEGGGCNLYGGVGKVIILLNELPSGRYIADGGTPTLGLPNTDQAGLFALSRWLLTMDYSLSGTTGYANVITVNTYDTQADYTTIPDATVGRPGGKPAFGGGLTDNAHTFLPVAGAKYDGLHSTAYGGLLMGRAVAGVINSIWSGVSNYLDSSHPRNGTAQFVTQNPRLIGTGGTNSGFHSITGSANVPANMQLNGNNIADCDITVSVRTDTDGETVYRFIVSGTSTVTGQKDIFIGLPALFSSGWSDGTYGPALVRGDKCRAFTEFRISGTTNKLLQASVLAQANSNVDNAYITSAGQPDQGAYVSRVYLHDDASATDSGMGSATFTPLVSRVFDTINQLGNSNAGFGIMGTLALAVSLFAEAGDAPVGTAIHLDFEIKGFGLRKITEAGYSASGIAMDYFTDTDGVLLTAHVPTSGGAWIKATGYTVDGAITSNRVRSNAAGFTCLYNNTDPGADNYAVRGRCRRITGVTGAGIAARVSSTAADFYAMIYEAGAGNIVLYRYNAGTPTALQTVATTIADATDFVMQLEVETIRTGVIQLRMFKDGVQLGVDTIDTSGSAITARGRCGVTLQGGSSTTGVHIDTVLTKTL